MYYQIKGLVLSVQTQGEADKSAMIYSYQWGKVSVIFPSAKKINAKLSFAAEPLTESEFLVYQSQPSMRPKATGANIINNHSQLKTNFQRNLYGLYAAEISSKLVPYNVENKEKYKLISRIWEVLENCQNLKRALAAFVLRFLNLSGYSFIEYLKQDGQGIGENIEKQIKKLSQCRGADLDKFNFDDDRIWKYIESYLIGYIKKPSVGIFLEKISQHY